MIPGVIDSTKIENVSTTTLDFQLFNNTDICSIKMMKIDVEGYEFNVLRGAENIIKKFKPIILCEISPEWISLTGHSVKDLFDYMVKLNYSILSTDDLKLIKTNNANIVSQIEILFIPKDNCKVVLSHIHG
jgi:hypothetical protein